MCRPSEVDPMQLSVDVMAAVASLYDDKLKPYGDILLQRLLERVTVDGRRLLTCIGLGGLCRICHECPRLTVKTESAGNFSVVLIDPRGPWRRLVDPADSSDPYSQELARGEHTHILARAVWTRRRDPMDTRSHGYVPRGSNPRTAALYSLGRGRGAWTARPWIPTLERWRTTLHGPQSCWPSEGQTCARTSCTSGCSS